MAFSNVRTLTKNMSMKRSNHIYIPIHLAISLSSQVLSNDAATQPCQDKPLLELAFQPAVNVGTGKICIRTVCIPLAKKRYKVGVLWALARMKKSTTNEAKHLYICIYTKLLVAPIGRMRDEKDEDRLPSIEVKTPKNQ